MNFRLMAALAAAVVFLSAADLTPEQKLRSTALQKRLLAPCCWSETVATHRSETALEMRAEINRMVAAGRSDREILDHFKGRYGMRILIEPEGERAFWIHFAPPVVLLLGFAWVSFVIHRWLKRRERTAESA